MAELTTRTGAGSVSAASPSTVSYTVRVRPTFVRLPRADAPARAA